MDARKELKKQYASRTVTGGVYAIRNIKNDMLLLLSTTDMPGSLNRFLFAKQTGACIHPKLQCAWGKNGSDFVLDVIEALAKKEEQSDSEFSEDIKVLLEMTRERYLYNQLY